MQSIREEHPMDSGLALPVNERNRRLERFLEISRTLSASPRAGTGTTTLDLEPFLYHVQAFGVLKVVNKTEQPHYTEEDLIILETLASQAAIAVQNVRLMSKVQHSLDPITLLGRMKSGSIAIQLKDPPHISERFYQVESHLTRNISFLLPINSDQADAASRIFIS